MEVNVFLRQNIRTNCTTKRAYGSSNNTRNSDYKRVSRRSPLFSCPLLFLPYLRGCPNSPSGTPPLQKAPLWLLHRVPFVGSKGTTKSDSVALSLRISNSFIRAFVMPCGMFCTSMTLPEGSFTCCVILITYLVFKIIKVDYVSTVYLHFTRREHYAIVVSKSLKVLALRYSSAFFIALSSSFFSVARIPLFASLPFSRPA